jgi:hypothetical protein
VSKPIRVTMFEVQLGAALLLEFQTFNGPVRVLADAGMRAAGYSADHVLKKLKRRIPRDRRIDLMIGTHYDEDHLNGLVPIIEDGATEIGEAWLPPVVNDTIGFALDDPVTAESMLAEQFYADDHERALAEYLAVKQNDIVAILQLERQLANSLEVNRGDEPKPIERPEVSDRDAFFRHHAIVMSGDPCDHAVEAALDPSPSVQRLLSRWQKAWRSSSWEFMHYLPDMRTARAMAQYEPQNMAGILQSLAGVRHMVAKEAINATALHRVTRALKANDVPIRSHWIAGGKPQRYAWDGTRFARTRKAGSQLAFDLLGPSLRLIRKHRHRLPPRAAAVVAFEVTSPIKSITPSNQLSYVMCFHHVDQRILVAGDAGMVDFSAKARAPYYPDLLEALQPLHVVQIAHHGGRNAHFYRVLARADYAKGLKTTYLLLSHATRDAHRPSAEFVEFALRTADAGTPPSVLFTSKPDPNRVKDFAPLVHPPTLGIQDVGDVVLDYDGSWTVLEHAIQP